MSKSKVFIGLVCLVYLLFLVFEFSGNRNGALCMNFLVVPSITALYLFSVKKKELLFCLFFLIYTLGDLIFCSLGVMPSDFADKIYVYIYYTVNPLYIISYGVLLIHILKSLNISEIVKNFKVHIVILLGLNTYLVYVLHMIIGPHFEPGIDYFIEILYNVVLLFVMSTSFLGYLNDDSKKRLYLFLGTLLIAFSEVMDIAFYYVSDTSILHMLATTLCLFAFWLFYQQSKLGSTE